MHGSWWIKLMDRLADLNERGVFERRLRRHYHGPLPQGAGLVIDVGADRGQTIRFFRRKHPNCMSRILDPVLERLRSEVHRDVVFRHDAPL